jgi:MYXO-CTERM domain-containing protein
MFTVEHVEPALEIALDLAAAYHDDESLSDVRVGLAVGQVLQREADCYGPVVNRASRIVGISFPGTVVTDDDIHTEMVGDDDDGPSDPSGTPSSDEDNGLPPGYGQDRGEAKGCAIAGNEGAWSLLLLAGALVRRRRRC